MHFKQWWLKQVNPEHPHTVDHLRGHPVGVAHYSVSLPAVRLLLQETLVLDLVFHHQPSQPKVCHHHTVILKGDRGHTDRVISAASQYLEYQTHCKPTYKTIHLTTDIKTNAS